MKQADERLKFPNLCCEICLERKKRSLRRKIHMKKVMKS